MRHTWKGQLAAGAVALGVAAAAFAAPPPPPATNAATTAPVSPVKALLADENNLLEREIAARMLRRADLAGDRRARLELEIDLRIIERAAMVDAAEAKFESDEQAAAWIRAKQLREAIRA